MARRPDSHTGDMFAVPAPPASFPGALNINKQLRAMLSKALKECPLSRYEIAARMSESTGDEISKNQLDAWTAESRDAWRFPVEYLPAFEMATESHDISAWLASLIGGQLYLGRDVLQAELGRLEHSRDQTAEKIKRLKQQIGRGA